MSEEDLLHRTAEHAARYLASLDTRPVRPEQDYEALLASFDGPVPELGLDPTEVIDELVERAEAGLTAMGSGRYFGFVIGGALPASTAADWLVSTWDQNAGLAQPTPATSAIEAVAGRWVLELLGLPPQSSFAFVTGCQMAHVTCLAAARHEVYRRLGYDLPTNGLAGAPPLRVVVGGHVHVTLRRALRLLGIGAAQEHVVPTDGRGRLRPELLGDALAWDGPLIVCAQVGEVNTGSCDDLEQIIPRAHEAGAWVHIDGAFGLWAAAVPELSPLVRGHATADSWATDAHKWLNVSYDCGIAVVADPLPHAAAMEYVAPYLAVSDAPAIRDPMGYSPEFSRRARSVPVWAVIRSLGREGIVDLVRRTCEHARALAAGLAEIPGCEVLNEVVLNQVLVRFETDERTSGIVATVQAEGEAWMSPSRWQDRSAIRLSVSNWRTNERDIERTLAAFRRAADSLPA